MIHKEGYPSIIIAIIVSSLAIYLTGLTDIKLVEWLGYALAAFLMITILQFFRNPKRNTIIDDNTIIAPADGKVVVIEEVDEPEFLKTKCRQISIFMSPINVHVNRYPINGIVKYVKYHAGLYLVAWHPKSSTENERTTVVVEHKNGSKILFRQIAGALARRIVYYAKENDQATQGSEFGFIKFGSRVDVFIPLDCKVTVNLEQKVRGGETVIAKFS